MTIRTAADNKSTILQVAGVDKLKINDTGVVEADYFKTPAGVLSPVGAFRNKITNGAPIVRIRTPSPITDAAGVSPYIADRWRMITRTGASLTGGTYNSGSGSSWRHLAVTVNSSKSPANNDQFRINQGVEGTIIGHWRLGTAAAATVTLSFESCHSVAGIYSGALYSTASSRSYVFEYTQAAPNTWERHEITIPLDTSGTWTIDAGAMLSVTFDYGSGSQYATATVGSWVNGVYLRSTTSLTPVTQTGAVLRLQAIQLEEGPYATPFEHRPIGVEIPLCERYFESIDAGGYYMAVDTLNSSTGVITVSYRQVKRATPSVSPTWTGGNVPTYSVTVGTRATIYYAISYGGSGIPALNTLLVDAEIS